LLSRVFRYAVATGRAERDPAADLRGAIASVRTRNFAAVIDPKSVGALLRAIENYQGQPSVIYALKLAPLVFVRPGELRGAEWSEIDLAAAEWRIPASRMKMDERHIVPLPRQAVALLRELKTHTGNGRLLFPGLRSREREISENTLNAALRRMGYGKDDMTGHGFRTVASTLLNELGWHPDLIELQLAHKPRDRVRAAYNRAERLEERRQMMQTWADYLDRLKTGGDIVPVFSEVVR
jgi:integrase